MRRGVKGPFFFVFFGLFFCVGDCWVLCGGFLFFFFLLGGLLVGGLKDGVWIVFLFFVNGDCWDWAFLARFGGLLGGWDWILDWILV